MNTLKHKALFNQTYTHIKKIRTSVLVYMTHNMAMPYFKLTRKAYEFPLEQQKLALMPTGSLGNDLVLFLEKRKLHLLPYYEKHDIKHVLLDYDTTEEGEVCLQCFMLGNGRITLPIVVAIGFGVLYMPEYWGCFKKAYTRGKNAPKIYNWDWFKLLKMPTTELKNIINN
jgi:hypothetical protein